jgi:hypothetical protein
MRATIGRPATGSTAERGLKEPDARKGPSKSETYRKRADPDDPLVTPAVGGLPALPEATPAMRGRDPTILGRRSILGVPDEARTAGVRGGTACVQASLDWAPVRLESNDPSSSGTHRPLPRGRPHRVVIQGGDERKTNVVTPML